MRALFLLFFLFCHFTSVAQENMDFVQTDFIDFIKVQAEVHILPEEKKVEGKARYNFLVLKETDSLFIDAKGMKFSYVRLNGKTVSYRVADNKLWVKNSFFSSAEENVIELEYTVYPKQAMYFINWEHKNNSSIKKQVWTQGQGKYNSHWLPSFDDAAEKAIFSLAIDFRKDYEVISNGELESKTKFNDSLLRWHFSMKNPMSSYLLALAVGKYEKKELLSDSGIPVSLFYYPKDENLAEPTYRHTGKIFNFLEKETGIPYPWLNYKQVPVQDFLYAGMENTGATIFSDALVVDDTGYNDQNYVNVNAHEMAHQWFGNYVTAKSGEHHWLQEGFATFYALQAERQIFGDDYYYWKLFQSAEELKTLSDMGKGESLLDPRAGSLTFYQKGAWALHVLREKVGAEAFKAAVTSYLKQFAYGVVTTDDFLLEVEKAGGIEMDEFKENWLLQSAFQGTEALQLLKKSEFIKNYMEIAALREVPFINKKEVLLNALAFPVNDYIGQEVVFQLKDAGDPAVEELYRKALETGNLYVRQAVALSMEEIPSSLKPQFISMLNDDSYLTIENALLKLWLNFPDEAEKWLEKTRGINGFSNYNVKMLWLVINLVSPGVEPEMTSDYYEELSSYTRSYQPFEVRQNAFGYLYQINAFTPQNLKDLVEGAQHHNTRFRDYSRKLLEKLLQDREYRDKFVALQEEMTEKDRLFLNSRMNM